ncbi:DUF4270 family protein [Flavihumibacter profundi]|uniref:DUF4270 family protein n=1 Tax=Flavihumibacter profundi TaxID=2716883 RepID=UPI001CC3A4E3|nr:DUF4270 family protein [Flavihumibacter profundi]MBZ5855636.1 DUF4270 domain-containing protein [Flavihumibacter profundi]
MISCTKQAQYIETVTPSENPYLIQVDTFGGNFVVFREDSFVTSSDNYALVGIHSDPLFGKTSCEHYVRFERPVIPDLTNTSKFDSLELILKLSHGYYGDTLSSIALTVNRLAQSINNDNSVFYNTSSFSAYPVKMGAEVVKVRPIADDSIRLLLDPQFGLELFELIRDKSSQVTNTDQFLEYFKGIKISTEPASTNVIVGLQNKMQIRLHYHDDDGSIEQREIDLSSSSSPYQFNYIKKDFSGSPLSGLVKSNELNSSALNNQLYLQELTHLRTRIIFPQIKEILSLANFVKVLNAQLEIKPDNASWVKYPLPQKLNVYLQNYDKTYSGGLTDATGGFQDGSLSIDQLYGLDTRYVFDVTNYVVRELTTNSYTSQNLVLAGSSGDSTFQRLVANTTASAKLRSRLILSLLIYQNQ